MRRSFLVVAIAVTVTAAALGCASDGSALIGVTTVVLTATGPSPKVARMTAAQTILEFVDHDSVPHRVVFANGRCTLDVAPGEPTEIATGVNACPFTKAGRYAYREDGRLPGRVDIRLAPRSVVLTARTHVVRRGTRLTLHGSVTFASASPPLAKAPFPVVILARHDRTRPFRRIATLVARRGNDGLLVWHLRVRPGIRTTYVAEVTGRSRIWRKARSGPFTVRVRRR